LLKLKNVTLEEIAHYPLVTYDSAFAGRSKIDHAFQLRDLKPDVRRSMPM
jgi:LysR family cys regulon transcriptional activator